MDPVKFKDQMSSLNYGNVMAAAARDYAKVRGVADFFSYSFENNEHCEHAPDREEMYSTRSSSHSRHMLAKSV